MNRYVLILLSVLSFELSVFATDDSPYFHSQEMSPINPGRIHGHIFLDHFMTQANYEEGGGSFEDLPNGGSYSNTSIRARATFDIHSQWRLISGLRFSHAISDDGTFQRTNSELNEISAGLAMAPFYSLSSRFYIDILGTFALNEVEPATDDSLTGEGAHFIFGGIRYSHLVSRFEIFSSLHLQYYMDGRSTRIPWRVGGLYHFGSLKILAALSGYESITDDEKEPNPSERTSVTNRVNGGSLKYYSVNPQLLNSQVGVMWQFRHDFVIEGGLTKTINGDSTAEGIALYAGASLFWGGNDEEVRRPIRKKRRRVLRRGSKPAERFRTQEESYDEDLFQERRKKRKKKRRPINIDKAIDETIKEFE